MPPPERFIQELRALTPKQRRLLKLMLLHEHEQMTRRDIAQRLGRRYLQRHDIKVLNHLVGKGWVMSWSERLNDDDDDGSDVERKKLFGRHYRYQINRHTAIMLHSINSKQPKHQDKTPAPEPQPTGDYEPGLVEKVLLRLFS